MELAMRRRHCDFNRPPPASVRVKHDPLLIVLIAASAVVLGLHAVFAPPTLALPLLSSVCAVAAAAVALVAWLASGKQGSPSRITYWDISGALYLISASAAIMGEPEHLLSLMNEVESNR
jgi:hypothetical protein